MQQEPPSANKERSWAINCIIPSRYSRQVADIPSAEYEDGDEHHRVQGQQDIVEDDFEVVPEHRAALVQDGQQEYRQQK